MAVQEQGIAMAVANLQRQLGKLLHDERKRRGLSKTALAHQAGVSRPTVIAAEAGNGVSSQNLLAVMAALELTFAGQTASPRPRLKDLMRSERERLAMLQSARAEPSAAGWSPAAQVSTTSTTAPRESEPTDHRPRLKDVMAAERARQARLQKLPG
jgi:transcriptional regulator with XRE-family HTH domain